MRSAGSHSVEGDNFFKLLEDQFNYEMFQVEENELEWRKKEIAKTIPDQS